MDSNLPKCFICDVECGADDKNIGTNIARRLTMPMTSVLSKCLRTMVDVENEYFCTECVIKMEDYDQLIQLSLQIETELYELYQRKTTDPCYLLDAEIIVGPDAATNDELIQSENLKLENETINSEPEELNETYDEMVVEYLDDFEAQLDDIHLNEEHKFNAVTIEKLNENNSGKQKTLSNSTQTATRKPKRNKGTTKFGNVGSTSKSKIKRQNQTESPESTAEDDFKCHMCAYVAENRSELEEHKTIKHIDEIKRLVCDICGRSYKSKSALCVHVGMHNGRNAHGTCLNLYFTPYCKTSLISNQFFTCF